MKILNLSQFENEQFTQNAEPINEYHHLLSGDNSLDDLSTDLIEFIRYQMTHSIKKKKEYDNKKFIYYYEWIYSEILDWFVENKKEFHYPAFLIDRGSTISLKISIGRMVKGNRNQHNSMDLIRTKGNEKASHIAKKTDDNTKNHVIYFNTYYLSRVKNTDVRKYIMSDDFEESLRGTVKHEFMHAFDSYVISSKETSQHSNMTKIYKKYRADNHIGKDWVLFKDTGEWSGNKYSVDKQMLSKNNNLRTFLYMLLYYMTGKEMRAYMQTFYNQIIISKKADCYNSDIFKRYKIIYAILSTDFEESIIVSTFDKKTKKDFNSVFPKLKGTEIDYWNGFKKMVLQKLDVYFKKLYTILYDLKETL